jgi:hypothetical protein
MLAIDHHVQKALYKFNREMKALNRGGDNTFAGWAAIKGQSRCRLSGNG